MLSLSTPKAPRCRCNDALCAAHQGREACGYTAHRPTPPRARVFQGLCRACANALARAAHAQLEITYPPRRRIIRR